ncbi:unnamed protein product [Caenorhabditis angaria]|uniref:E2F/DP family winged-helix DNA-binding domain-containing protein n=1 Tax=Caenorhabditis angaria TaxID=860376 RepID=A0A9P1MX02_9PELO|nr:unnamed protein product [Caenorhabditis angaria]
MNLYGSSMMFTMEANKENIPPGSQFGLADLKEPIVLPVAQNHPHPHPLPTPKITPKPSPATSLRSDASFLPDSPAVNTSADEAEDDLESTSRKEKSLGLLCQRFLIAMNEETRANGTNEVHLETVARKMNVEKRRIYDIVNVMEALDAMAKTNKSYYQWHGLEQLPKLMMELQNEAVMEHLPERVLRVEQAMCSFTELSSSSSSSTSTSTSSNSSNSQSLVGSFAPCTSREQDKPSSAQPVKTERSRVDNRDRQGRNSLAQLCRRFLMVLLSNPRNIRKVSLDVASTVLIKDPETEGFEPPSRSRCRRLYDIANVLVALGLIKKVHYLFGTKKIPLFVYCGPEPDETATFDVYTSIERLLSAPQSTPVTPTIKATTDKLVQQLSAFGKRSSSENQLGSTNRSYHKVPKTEPTIIPISPHSSSLMMFAELAAAESLRMQNSPIRNMLFPAFLNNHPIRPTCSTLPFARNSPKKPHCPAPMKHSMSNILNPTNLKSTENLNLKFPPKPPTVILDHTTTSPFQLVQQKKQREKKIFGEIQNFQ